ncbi:MAG: hypothetical protein ACTSO7_01910 [Candidatus Heimdallarchaeota archaeon]
MALSEVQKLFMATVTEGIVLLFVTFVVIMLYVRFARRKRTAALTLAVAFSFWDVAIICLFIMRLLSYLVESGRLSYSYAFSDLGITLGYVFSAISNVFILVFCAIVFAQSPLFRKTGMLSAIVVGALNGITVGMLIGNAITAVPDAPVYKLGPTIYHLLLTILSFSALIIFTSQPYRQSTSKWEKAGFRFIILSGIFGILIYLCFALDVALGDFAAEIFGDGYTIFFFLAYVFAVLMCSFAYLGYVMPKFVRDYYQIQEEKEREKQIS